MNPVAQATHLVAFGISARTLRTTQPECGAGPLRSMRPMTSGSHAEISILQPRVIRRTGKRGEPAGFESPSGQTSSRSLPGPGQPGSARKNSPSRHRQAARPRAPSARPPKPHHRACKSPPPRSRKPLDRAQPYISHWLPRSSLQPHISTRSICRAECGSDNPRCCFSGSVFLRLRLRLRGPPGDSGRRRTRPFGRPRSSRPSTVIELVDFSSTCRPR